MKQSTFFLFLIPLICLGISSCASTKSSPLSTESIRTLHVKKIPDDSRRIDRLIAARLKEMGYKATSSGDVEEPDGVDAILFYEDRWMWDVTMYMKRLTITVYDGDKSEVIGSAESYRPSLQRKSPENMVAEVLEQAFGK